MNVIYSGKKGKKQPAQSQPSQPPQQEKKSQQKPGPPPHLGAVGGRDAGPSQEIPQQQTEPPSGVVGTRHGQGRGQYRGQAGMVMRTVYSGIVIHLCI